MILIRWQSSIQYSDSWLSSDDNHPLEYWMDGCVIGWESTVEYWSWMGWFSSDDTTIHSIFYSWFSSDDTTIHSVFYSWFSSDDTTIHSFYSWFSSDDNHPFNILQLILIRWHHHPSSVENQLRILNGWWSHPMTNHILQLILIDTTNVFYSWFSSDENKL